MIRLVSVCLVVCALALAGGVSFAAQRSALTVTPLADDTGDTGTPGGTGDRNAQGGAPPVPAGPAGPATPAAPNPAVEQDSPSARDGLVIAYLVELARKQNRPCPSGATPPAPPSLTFSEPLCRVAGAMGGGGDMLAALTAQGLYATKWRMFSAADPSAQQVVARLREAHCEALLEPHTHIGAVRDEKGWRIVMAVLAEKPENSGEAAASAPDMPPATTSGTPPAPPPAALPATMSDAPPATTPAAPPATTPGAPAGQEARALFVLLNEQRAKGGSCSGRAWPPAPALAFDPGLQENAERDAAAAAAKGSFAEVLAGMGGLAGYAGTGIAKLTMTAKTSPSVALDSWLLNPKYCERIFSPKFVDAGVAHTGGYWMLLLGEKGQGVPSPEIPASRRQ
ncbi:MAG: hypothetical protein LBV01_05570 [Deltaproteobacteria bacterium]|jgi:uncharacterized protein YkwD|nr:hypothetical protein [Deltaproteobacteria bacterium]